MLSARLEHFDGSAPSTHRVRDLSKGGIRIDQASELRQGATVLISVGSLEAIAATIVWVEAGSAGLAFAEQINPDAARKKAVVTPLSGVEPASAGATGGAASTPRAGWIGDLQNPYGR
ncbi:MAG: hypothetical protein JWN21_2717 [Sphingomonas bacterium]|nr:hypothetical protein [Sphingomonas bacterium]